jgi:hypothetical protein
MVVWPKGKAAYYILLLFNFLLKESIDWDLLTFFILIMINTYTKKYYEMYLNKYVNKYG